MKFHDLELTKKTDKIRAGRGISAGRGKTAGRGTKGQKARTGKKLRAGFEGGQNSLMTRIPKLKGFKSKRTAAQVVYTGNLSLMTGKTVDNKTLFEQGLIGSEFQAVKIISKGEVKKAYSVSVQGISESAQKAVEKAGGSVTSSDTPMRPKTSKKEK
jgi:large subunit ribosomal protein L15